MRPSLRTLAGMTLAAGSLAIGGVAATASAETGSTAEARSAHAEHVIVMDAEANFADEEWSAELVGSDVASPFEDGPDWLEDGCPPCGMG